MLDVLVADIRGICSRVSSTRSSDVCIHWSLMIPLTCWSQQCSHVLAVIAAAFVAPVAAMFVTLVAIFDVLVDICNS